MVGTAAHHSRQFSEMFRLIFMIHYDCHARVYFYFYFSVSQVVEAFSLSPAEFEQKYGVQKPDVKDDNLIFHCQSGRRAKKAMESVKELGFDK